MLSLDTIKTNLLYPVLGRAGTVVSTTVIGWGVSDQHANWIALGLMGLGGLGWDLSVSWARKRLIVNKTLEQALKGLLG